MEKSSATTKLAQKPLSRVKVYITIDTVQFTVEHTQCITRQGEKIILSLSLGESGLTLSSRIPKLNAHFRGLRSRQAELEAPLKMKISVQKSELPFLNFVCFRPQLRKAILGPIGSKSRKTGHRPQKCSRCLFNERQSARKIFVLEISIFFST